jgi:F-type H+-transporting ATPase subunit a
MNQPVDTSASLSFFRAQEELPSISSHVFGDVGIFSIANSTTTIILIAIFFAGVALIARGFSIKSSSFQNLCEIIYEAIGGFISQVVGDKEIGKKITPYVGAIMVYLVTANLLPMIPVLNNFYVVVPSGEHVALFRGATTDFNTTFGLALAIIIFMQYFGMKEQGVFGYLSHFIQIKQVYAGFKKGIGEGFMAIIGFFVGLIEIISELAKMASLSLRLFGNMFAHEMLTVILLGAFAFGLPAVWMGMGLLVGLVQAVVFSALVTVYYSLVLKKEDH